MELQCRRCHRVARPDGSGGVETRPLNAGHPYCSEHLPENFKTRCEGRKPNGERCKIRRFCGWLTQDRGYTDVSLIEGERYCIFHLPPGFALEKSTTPVDVDFDKIAYFDLETCSLLPETRYLDTREQRIIEFGAVYNDTSFVAFVDPQGEFAEPHISGITNEEVRGQAPFPTVFVDFLEYLEAANPVVVVAHNGAKFDLQVLHCEMKRHNLQRLIPRLAAFTFVDSMDLVANYECRKLRCLTRDLHVAVEDRAHRAVDDCYALKRVVEKIEPPQETWHSAQKVHFSRNVSTAGPPGSTNGVSAPVSVPRAGAPWAQVSVTHDGTPAAVERRMSNTGSTKDICVVTRAEALSSVGAHTSMAMDTHLERIVMNEITRAALAKDKTERLSPAVEIGGGHAQVPALEIGVDADGNARLPAVGMVDVGGGDAQSPALEIGEDANGNVEPLESLMLRTPSPKRKRVLVETPEKMVRIRHEDATPVEKSKRIQTKDDTMDLNI
eukprot:GEMP01019751.1.p1 GENE.GEMP01019751.1~~GEMP01019751.1.p1  ORF type:complete len:497 (+),score=127.16 GEMP01019751.1:41-1531(+)